MEATSHSCRCCCGLLFMLVLGCLGCQASYTKARTQANCACLPSWTDMNGTTHSGCANPDNDALGPWCLVSPSSCLGYYSSYTNSSGAVVFYDYCENVRERTAQGCLCAPEWSMGPGRPGKQRYTDGCASPEKPGVRICRVDLATCPESSTAGEFDICEQAEGAAALQVANSSQLPAGAADDVTGSGSIAGAAAARTSSYHSCACEKWSYEYADGSQTNFSSCANPDGDPLGSWCAVDPVTCHEFAGEMRIGNQTIAYDYCDSQYRQAPADVCAVFFDHFSQCGGKSNCTEYGCIDAQWPGVCCSRGLSCVRQHAFYYQCEGPQDASLPGALQHPAADGVIVGGGGTVNFIPTAAGSLLGSSSSSSSDTGSEGDGQSIITGSSLASDILSTSSSNLLDPSMVASSGGLSAQGGEGSDPALFPLTPAFLPKQPGKKIYSKLKIDTDYDALASSPLKMAHFKADLVQWLKTVAANPEYIYGAGVDQVLKGSVIALAHVQLTSDAPAEEVTAAMARLQANVNSSYTTTDMPADWGKLQSYIVAPSRAELSQGGAANGGNGAEEYQAAQTSLAAGSYSTRAVLTTGAIVGIVVGAACLVGLMGFVLGRALANEKAKRHDADLAAKIEYYDELQEGDLEGLDDDGEEYDDEGSASEGDDANNESSGDGGGGLHQEQGHGCYGQGEEAEAGASWGGSWRRWWLHARAGSPQHTEVQVLHQPVEGSSHKGAAGVQQGPRSPAHVCQCHKGPTYDHDGGSGSAGGAAAFAASHKHMTHRRISMASVSSSGGGSSNNYSGFRSSTTGGGAAGEPGGHGYHHGHVAAAAVLPLDKDR